LWRIAIAMTRCVLGFFSINTIANFIISWITFILLSDTCTATLTREAERFREDKETCKANGLFKMQTRIQAQAPPYVDIHGQNACPRQANRSGTLMSIYLSSDSISDCKAAKNVDLDGQLLDEEDDKEEEGMINAETCQRFDPSKMVPTMNHYWRGQLRAAKRSSK
jgi:hypothetical protein